MSRDWGFNFARFLLSWDALETTAGIYDDVYLDRVAESISTDPGTPLHMVTIIPND